MSKAVQSMFASVASRYDVTNDVLSFGIHRLWRLQAVRFAEMTHGCKVLDLCTGTGDFANCIADEIGSDVVCVDFVQEMLRLAQKKVYKHTSLQQQNSKRRWFVQADVLELPFSEDSFDVVAISFGIRNVDDPLEGLNEIHRLLRPGGKLLVLEFGQPRLPLFASMYRHYSKFFVPMVGQMLTGNRAAYEYLPRTSREFPCGDKFLNLLQKANYRALRMKSFIGGVAYAYVGTK